MTQKTFAPTLKKIYPNLYDYMFREGMQTDDLISFIKKRNIPLSGGKPYVSYQDTWDYIVANEDMHEWWML